MAITGDCKSPPVRVHRFESYLQHQIKSPVLYGVFNLVPDIGREPSFVQQKRFGVAIEAKKCLHFFVNERKRQSRCPISNTLTYGIFTLVKTIEFGEVQ